MYSFADIRQAACRKMPFAIRAFYSLTPVVSDKVPDSPTCDAHWRVYYNPDTLAEWSEKEFTQAIWRLCREVARLLQSHPKRIKSLIGPEGKNHDHYKGVAAVVSNTLCNYLVAPEEEIDCIDEFNDGYSEPWELPGCRDLAGKPKSYRLETLYRRVVKAIPPPEQNEPPDDGRDGDNDEGDDRESYEDSVGDQGGGSDDDREPQSNNRPQNRPDQSQDSRDDSSRGQNGAQSSKPIQMPDLEQPPNPGSCGSSLDGKQRPWELPPPRESPSDRGKPRAGPQSLADQKPVNEQGIQRSAVKAIEGAGVGRVSGARAPKEWATEAISQQRAEPPRELLSLLRDFAETQMGYEMRRFDGRNRRQHEISRYNQTDIYLPHYYSPKMDLMIVLDTSGSMNQEQTTKAMVYIASVIESLNLGQGAYFYTGDTDPIYQGLIDRNTVDHKTFIGGGGTNMPNVLERAYRNHVSTGRSCNLVLCVTDGLTPWRFEEILPVPLVIAVVPTSGGDTQERLEQIIEQDNPTPDWAEVTYVMSNQKEVPA